MSTVPPQVVPVAGPAVEQPAGHGAGSPFAALPAGPEAGQGEAAARVRAGASIRGLLRDSAGEPMGGFAIQLWPRNLAVGGPRTRGDSLAFPLFRPRSRGRQDNDGPQRADTVNTDAAGAFAFVDLPPGECEVRCAMRPETAATVQLEPARCSEVVLQLPPDVTIVTGTLVGEGADEPGNDVAFYRGDDQLFRQPCKDGVRCVLAAGRYELRVGAPWLREHDLWFSRHELIVPPGIARLTWRHPFGGTPCEVIVRAPAAAGATIGVDVNSRHLAAERRRDTAYTNKAGRVGEPVRMLLPPGTWCLHAHGDELTAMPEREVVVGPDSPALRIEFDAQPAAPVDLVLGDRRGARVLIAPELVPPIVAGGGECPCCPLNGTRTAKLRFPHVPLGPGELRLEDRQLDGVHSFLPFEPLPPVVLLVQAGQPNALELTVQRRPFVDLRACDPSGREDGNACIAVWLGERRVRGRDEQFSQRWAAWLPAGTYRVVVERNGALREHDLTVARTDVTMRYRP